MSNADTVIAALRTGQDRLAKFVSNLDEGDLAKRSGAVDWDVSQVLSHLGSGAEISQNTIRSATAGEANPGAEPHQAIWDRWDASSRRERADGFLRESEALTVLYESLDEATRNGLRIDLGFMPEPVDVAVVARMRLNELTLHGWDVFVAFDDHATLPSEATAELLHGEPDMLGRISKPDQLEGRSAVIEVTTTAPDSLFTLNLGERISTVLEAPKDPDGTLVLPAEAWLRLVAGRLAHDHTPRDVLLTGATDLDLFRRIFAGY
jgi:uncharacterized protein (TIGR03083 family)